LHERIIGRKKDVLRAHCTAGDALDMQTVQDGAQLDRDSKEPPQLDPAGPELASHRLETPILYNQMCRRLPPDEAERGWNARQGYLAKERELVFQCVDFPRTSTSLKGRFDQDRPSVGRLPCTGHDEWPNANDLLSQAVSGKLHGWLGTIVSLLGQQRVALVPVFLRRNVRSART
jgi:hypothetical protein